MKSTSLPIYILNESLQKKIIMHSLFYLVYATKIIVRSLKQILRKKTPTHTTQRQQSLYSIKCRVKNKIRWNKFELVMYDLTFTELISSIQKNKQRLECNCFFVVNWTMQTFVNIVYTLHS